MRQAARKGEERERGRGRQERERKRSANVRRADVWLAASERASLLRLRVLPPYVTPPVAVAVPGVLTSRCLCRLTVPCNKGEETAD